MWPLESALRVRSASLGLSSTNRIIFFVIMRTIPYPPLVTLKSFAGFGIHWFILLRSVHQSEHLNPVSWSNAPRAPVPKQDFRVRADHVSVACVAILHLRFPAYLDGSGGPAPPLEIGRA